MTYSRQLDYLLDFLQQDMQETKDIPQAPDEKWELFRALVNRRAPRPVSKEFLQVQNSFLQDVLQQKGITKAEDLQPVHPGGRLCLWQGDITTLAAGGIVNAANSALLGCFVPGHFCIDNAIHTFAGVQLRLYCAERIKQRGRPLETGGVEVTPAFNLPAKRILHTVGPVVLNRQVQQNQPQELAACYTGCLRAAQKEKLESIALCSISTGAFGYPVQEAAQVAVRTVLQFAGQYPQSFKRVIFVVHSQKDYAVYEKILKAVRL